MLKTRNVDHRAPYKIHYQVLSLGTAATNAHAFEFNCHFTGALVGLQLFASEVSVAGSIHVVITDETTGVVLLDTGALAVASPGPYLYESFPTPIAFLPPSDSQLDLLPLVKIGDVINVAVTLSGGLAATGLFLTPEYMGAR
jgi:hypothetical protein